MANKFEMKEMQNTNELLNLDDTGDYIVKIDGKIIDVYAARVSAFPYNCLWPNHQRNINQTELSAFVSFEIEKPVFVEVLCKKNFTNAIIRPLSKRIKLNQLQQKITFTLNKAGQFSLELDDHHNALHIFCNNISNYSERDILNATYNFASGVHNVGLLQLNSGESVYLQEGAVVYGSIYGENIENIKIFGRGIIDGGYEERKSMHCYENYTKGCIKFYNSKNIIIDGVILRDSAIWICNMFACENILIDNIKLVGNWRYNNDGIDIVNCKNCIIKNSFIRSFDDGIVIKGIPEFGNINVENIFVENCVVWCEWGRSLEIGAETVAEFYKNIVFRNCDLIHNSAVCLDVQNRSQADISMILFENINVEYSKFTTPEQIDNDDGKEYSMKNILHVPTLIKFENAHYTDWEFSSNYDYGISHNVFFNNINIFIDEDTPLPKCEFFGVNKEHQIFDITINGLYINGKKVIKNENFVMNEFTHDIKLI